MPVDLLSLFFITALLLGVAPGPDNIFVLTQSLAFGSRAGILIVLGLCTGLLIHTTLVVVGLAALVATSEYLLWVIKIIGASYLLYLAWQHWFEATSIKAKKVSIQLTKWQLYRRGIIMNASNPKVGLFFLAFLPQFVDVSYGPVTQQIILLGALFIISTVIVFGAIALLAGSLGRQINQSGKLRILLNRLVSVIFVLLAFNLFTGFF